MKVQLLEEDAHTSYHIKDIEELIYKDRYAKLVWLIRRKIKYFKFKGVMPEPEDILLTVLQKILTGSRKWDKEKFPDLKKFVVMVAISELRHYRRTKANNNFSIDSDFDESNDDETVRTGTYFFIKEDNDFLNEIYAKELHENFEACLEDDEDAKLVYYERIEGKSNKQIAENLGVNTQFVENAMKRIKRKFLELSGH